MIAQFDIGYPKKFGSCHIGLYQPILNRFLLTLCDIEHARELALIASGRYRLFLVNLTSADNYCENLIDNYCCENWSLPSTQILETAIHSYGNNVVDAKSLLECPTNYDLSNEKQYLQMCWYYLKLFDFNYVVPHMSNVYGWRIKRFMSYVFDLEDQGDIVIQNLKKQVMAELFLCKDVNSTKASLESIIAKAKNDFVF